MKKILSFALILLLLLGVFASCGNEEKTDVKVEVLNGTTGFGMAHLMEKNANGEAKNNYSFTVQKDATKIQGDLIAGTVDIAAVPTNLAAATYNKTNGGIQIIAINTLGVLTVMQNADSEKIESIADLEGKTIYCPAQNPAQILKFILQKNNINAVVETSIASPQELTSAFLSQKTKDESGVEIAIDIDIAVIPQPMATQVLTKKEQAGYRIALDLTKEWNKVSEEELVQGCIVARTDFIKNNPDAVNAFLAEYEDSIKFTNENPAKAAEYIVKYEIAADAALAEKAIPSCNIVYVVNKDMKDKMQNFLDELGIKLSEGEFYYINE